MAWPIVAAAPVVTERPAVCRALFENHGPVQRVPHDLTGLIVRPTKRLAQIARCLRDSPDKTNVSRVRAEAAWQDDVVKRRRIRYLLQETKPHRHRRRDALVVLEETRCELVGSLFDDGDRHDTHGDGTSPLAHHPVTSFEVSGPRRFPLGLRL